MTSALGAVGVGLGLAGVLGPPRSVQIGWLIPLIGVELQLDPLGGFFMALTGAVALAVGVYSIGYARRSHLGGFALPVLPVFVAAMLLVPAAASVSTFLLAWELMGEGRREVFTEALWRYLTFYREHMRLEETMVLPAAQAYLDDDDWAAVDAAFATNVNPLAHGRPRDPAYDRLFTRIVMRVKSPLGRG